jgi:hypothetical protein
MAGDIIKIVPDSDRDYYCFFKFRYLKIDFENITTYNCHAATPHQIDLNWLEKNPGQLFNTEINVAERRMMLVNQRNASCEQNCWPAEDVGASSPRLYQKSYEKTHFDVMTTPEILELTIGTDCNLSCSYCCKEYSSRWRNDILENGDYNITDGDFRYKKTLKDKDQRASKESISNTTNKLVSSVLEFAIDIDILGDYRVTNTLSASPTN